MWLHIYKWQLLQLLLYKWQLLPLLCIDAATLVLITILTILLRRSGFNIEALELRFLLCIDGTTRIQMTVLSYNCVRSKLFLLGDNRKHASSGDTSKCLIEALLLLPFQPYPHLPFQYHAHQSRRHLADSCITIPSETDGVLNDSSCIVILTSKLPWQYACIFCQCFYEATYRTCFPAFHWSARRQWLWTSTQWCLSAKIRRCGR